MDSTYGDFDLAPPMCGIHRPPQFPSGKTATALDEMDRQLENQLHWFFNQGEITSELLQNSRFKRYKRVVNLIFANNSLIETDQWASRIVGRGKRQIMRIFSSKSDVNNADRLYSLITEGECHPDTDEDIPVDYVLMCSHSRRFANLCDRDANNVRSILDRLNRNHKDICVVVWFDEADNFPRLLKEYIPKFKTFPNVARMVAITATPLVRFWEIMHESGYMDVDLIGEMPAASNYRRMSEHNLIYTDNIGIKSPVQNFKHILDNPGSLCYTETSETGIVFERRLPFDIRGNAKRILFVPGENRRSTHLNICEVAKENNKNTLILNGSDKAFFFHDGRPPLLITDYKNKMIAAGKRYGKMLFSDMSIMDVAVAMYNTPALRLQESDLVITGYLCVVRGVTFNRPDFQFTDCILSRYHYEEEDDIENIVQLVGRFHGNKDWVPKGINIYAPKQVLDVADKQIQALINFLETKPESMQYSDIFVEPNGIPLLATLTPDLVEKVKTFGKLTEKKREQFHKMLVKAEEDGDFQIVADFNKPTKRQIKFSLKEYTLESKRVFNEGDKAEARRFPQFYEHHTQRKSYGQGVKAPGHYTIDITSIDFPINKDFSLEAGTAFISFIFKDVN
jgi:hypothetical protein